MTHKKLAYLVMALPCVQTVLPQKATGVNIEQLTKPLVFTRSGLELFFSEQFNMPAYTEYILPSHFGHLAHFLHYSSTIHEPYDFVVTTFELFHIRLKNSHWVNALSLSLLLEQLPRYLEPLCHYDQQEELRQSIKDILYKRFISRFTKFSQNPMDGINTFDTFLETMDEVINPTAREISELITQAAQKKNVTELQNIVSRFIESALEKVIWNPRTETDSWDSVVLLAEQINMLHECGVISSPKTVNHLYWTLLYRYGYFLQSTDKTVSPTLYEYIKTDVATHDYPWLTMPETESLLTSKKEYLTTILWECITHQELEKQNIY